MLERRIVGRGEISGRRLPIRVICVRIIRDSGKLCLCGLRLYLKNIIFISGNVPKLLMHLLVFQQEIQD